MKYGGYDIHPVYAPGADFDFTRDGCLKARKPKKEDVLYYQIEDKDGKNWGNELSINEAKEWIDKLNTIDKS